MNTRHLTVWLPLIVIITVLASLLAPSPVQAAGEPPPPAGEKSPKTPAAADKPSPPATDNGYSAEIPVAAPVGTPDGAANAAAVALSVDAIAQAGAVLVGPDGSLLPLASQETAGVLAVGDVYFKGSGNTECSGGWCNYDNISSALMAFPFRNGTGMIYVTGGMAEPPAPVNVNGTAGLSKLTGLAWDGSTVYAARILGGLLTIQNMLEGFTVDGFYIGQGIYAHDNAGTLRLQNLWVTNWNGTGIFVNNHKGNIDLFNVTVAGANGVGAADSPTYGNGVYLDNCKWNPATSKCDNTGNVTISNSSFNGNRERGLYVYTGGSALLDGVDVVGNTDWFTWEGASLSVGKGATVKDSRFNDNKTGASGLKIEGAGALNLQNVEAQGNTGDGISLHVANDISINGALLAGNTAGYGAEVYSRGNITLNNIRSQGNKYSVVANNYSLLGPVKTVTVTNSSFTGTSGVTNGDGLQVKSKGNVTLNHIVAEGNNGNGITIDNAQLDGGIYRGSGSVSILNTLGGNELVYNTVTALDVQSKGAITVKGVYALGNQNGLVLDGCAVDQDPLHTTHNCLGKGNVTVSAVTVGNTSGGNGLAAETGGAISLDGSSFIANQLQVSLSNANVAAAKPVTVTNSSFNSTSGPASAGLVVTSKGNITLNKVQANLNLGRLTYGPMAELVSGILLDNCLVAGLVCTGSGTVSVLSSLGTSKAEGNGLGDGLFIHSKAAITVSGFSSTFNRGGAYINNLLGAGTLTIANSTFSYNNGPRGGLMALSAKAITLTGVEASQNNSGGGAYAQNGAGLTTTDPITISKSHFDQNRYFGMLVYSNGNLTLNNVSANLNNVTATTYGANLRSLYGGVTLLDTLGPNQFSFNANNGLVVFVSFDSNGAISLSGVSASYNSGGTGILLDNSSAATKTVTAQKILAEHNGVDGVNVRSKGSVTLNAVQANYNAVGYGVNIDNCGLPAPCEGSGNVSLLSTLGLNSMSNNKYGLWINTAGSVLVNGTTASNNSDKISGVSGVWIENYYTAGKTVTVNQGNFNANAGTALYIKSAGVITLNNIGASYNTGGNGDGLFIRNEGVGVTAGINILSTLGNNQFNGNSRWGLWVASNGNIALNKVIASDNGFIGSFYSGAFLHSYGATSSVTITCSAFNHNWRYGLELSMGGGVLTFKGVAANNNLATVEFGLGGKVPEVSWTVCGK